MWMSISRNWLEIGILKNTFSNKTAYILRISVLHFRAPWSRTSCTLPAGCSMRLELLASPPYWRARYIASLSRGAQCALNCSHLRRFDGMDTLNFGVVAQSHTIRYAPSPRPLSWIALLARELQMLCVNWKLCFRELQTFGLRIDKNYINRTK